MNLSTAARDKEAQILNVPSDAIRAKKNSKFISESTYQNFQMSLSAVFLEGSKEIYRSESGLSVKHVAGSGDHYSTRLRFNYQNILVRDPQILLVGNLTLKLLP